MTWLSQVALAVESTGRTHTGGRGDGDADGSGENLGWVACAASRPATTLAWKSCVNDPKIASLRSGLPDRVRLTAAATRPVAR